MLENEQDSKKEVESDSLLPRSLREEEDVHDDSLPLRIPYEEERDVEMVSRPTEDVYTKRSQLFEQLENEGRG
ncbi:hypothetical protein ACFFHM_02450 [Halalkalibacter kiskunsagensis]|uniref:Uncharacterized protein n=1 Tax=Halalkalibacter kiskunsagensis TaxID=1548599 RepID=A0ABV6K7Z8_9BACI